jgi:hypothetical protein
VSPRAVFFVAPSFFCRPEPLFVAPNEARGPSALTRLGMTSRDAVPKEVRDAPLSLGRTGWGAGQSRGDFFEQPRVEFTFLKI